MRFIPPLFLLAFILSPKIGIFRAEDILLLLCVPLLVRSSFRLHPSSVYWLFFLGIASIMTIVSFIAGTNTRGLWSALTLGKLAEYTLIARIVASCGSTRRDLRVAAGIAMGVLALYAAFEFEWRFDRAFNQGWFAGESNHVAGGIVILATLLPDAALVAVPLVALSGSRTAFASLLIFLSRFFIVEKRYRELLTMVLIVVACALFASPAAIHRWIDPVPGGVYQGPHVDRFESWKIILDETPILTGVGIGARPSAVYESAYFFVYGETGILGLVFFVGFLVALARFSPNLGTAVIFMSFTMNTILIARIAGPIAVIIGVTLLSQKNDGLR